MRRRALLSAACGVTAAAVAGCLATTSATYDLTVREWQTEEDRTFKVDAEQGETIRIEFQETQSHGAGFDIYYGPIADRERVYRVPGRSSDRGPTSTVEYAVEQSGTHSIVVAPCCRSGGGSAYAWIRIYVG